MSISPPPPPSSRIGRLRRGSAAFTFLLLVVVGGMGFFAFLVWQERERNRVAAEAEAAAQAAKEAQRPPKPDVTGELPDVEVTPKAPKKVEAPEPEAPVLPPLPPMVVTPPPPPTEVDAIVEGRNLLSALSRANYKFSPAIINAYINYARAKARIELNAENVVIPPDFLAWVDSDPDLRLSVYGIRSDSTTVLERLRELEIDSGREIVRKTRTQLALATAIVSVSEDRPNLKERPPLKLVIPGDPRKPVDTKDPKRTLDMNDHIINFLNDHEPIQGEVVGGLSEALPELVYDSKGVATSYSSKKKGKQTGAAKVKRKLIAADVMASPKLQQEFNAYMKSKGFDVNIDCGDHIIFPGQTEAVPKDDQPRIHEAYLMFKKAYEAKGLLALRDPAAKPSERFAYILMNEKRLPSTYGNGHKLPKFPLEAPWPMLTFLAGDTQPLREREDLFNRLKQGEFHTYGEYIGPIAQQYDFQSARRLSPYDFGYGSFQMMLKDGGVCGTMATMCVRSYNMANLPSTTAGQPGHCALIFAAMDGKRYTFQGGQYVTGGHDKTRPHMPCWYFDDERPSRPMFHHLATSLAVNLNERTFLESLVAFRIYNALPDSDREKYGQTFLVSALTHNPFNVAIANEVFTTVNDSATLLKLWQTFSSAVLANASKAGEARDGGLYLKSVRGIMTDHLAKLPEPADKSLARTAAKLIKQRADELEAEAEEERKKEAAEKAKKASEL